MHRTYNYTSTRAQNMESRKIQRVGAATFTVSLPREWVLPRNLGRERILIESAARIRSEHQNEIRHAIRRLMGIGIMEETANRVRLQCSLNPSNYPLDALVKRLYNLGFTMLTESVEALLTGDAALAEDA